MSNFRKLSKKYSRKLSKKYSRKYSRKYKRGGTKTTSIFKKKSTVSQRYDNPDHI